MEFDQRLKALREQGFWLSGLLEFQPQGPWKPPAAFRVTLRHKSTPSYVLGMGWGASPFGALAAAEEDFAVQKSRYSTQPRSLSLNDLDL